MTLQILLFWILAFLQAHSRTQLSKSNCPSKFYIEQANVTDITKQQIKALAQRFYFLYDNEALTSFVEEIVIRGNQDELSNFVKGRMTIYLIIIAVFIGLFVTLCICCIFQQSCPPQRFRRDLKKEPYKLSQFRIVAGFLCLFSIGIVVTSLVASTYIPTLRKNIEFTTCSLYVSLDGVLNGQQDTGWGGFNNLYAKIGNVSKFLTQSLPAISTYLTGNQWLIDQMQNLKQNNLNIYSNNKDASLITPNPSTTKNALDNGLDIPMIKSRFITRGLGPNGTFNTMVDDIDRGLRITQTLSSLAYDIQTSAKRIVDSSDTILANTNSSQQTMEMYISQLQEMKIYMDVFKKQFLTSFLYQAIGGLQGIFGIEILGALTCLMGIFAVYFLQIFSCKSIVTFTWAVFGLGFVGSVIVVYVTLGLGSLGYGFCNYFDSMLYSRADFNKLGTTNSQNPFNRLDSCFYGDGNVLQKFDLGEQMGTVTKLFQQIQSYYDFQNPLSTNFVDKSISSGKISSWMASVQKFKRGIHVDSDQLDTTDNNPNHAILSLNLYTNAGANMAVCANDRWVFDSFNCTLPNQTTYVTGTAQNGVALQAINGSICVSFNQKFSQLQTSSWSQSDFTRRYTQTRSECPSAYEKILECGYALIRYRDSRSNLFQGIYDELDSLNTKNVIFNNNISNFRLKVVGFQSNVSDLSNVVSNSIDGLLVSSDCRAIVDNLKFTYNMFCVNSMHDIIRIGWCSIFVCIFSLFGMIFGYIFSMWFGNVEKNHKLFQTGHEYQGPEEVSSSQILRDQNQKDLGKDLQKLGQFTTYVGKNNQDKKQQQKKAINSQDSSQEENPYANQLRQ